MTKYIYYDVIAMEGQFLHSSAAMTAAPALPVGSGHHRTQNPVWKSFFSPPRLSRLLHDSPVSAMVLPPLPLSLFLGAGGCASCAGGCAYYALGGALLALGCARSLLPFRLFNLRPKKSIIKSIIFFVFFSLTIIELENHKINKERHIWIMVFLISIG